MTTVTATMHVALAESKWSCKSFAHNDKESLDDTSEQKGLWKVHNVAKRITKMIGTNKPPQWKVDVTFIPHRYGSLRDPSHLHEHLSEKSLNPVQHAMPATQHPRKTKKRYICSHCQPCFWVMHCAQVIKNEKWNQRVEKQICRSHLVCQGTLLHFKAVI